MSNDLSTLSKSVDEYVEEQIVVIAPTASSKAMTPTTAIIEPIAIDKSVTAAPIMLNAIAVDSIAVTTDHLRQSRIHILSSKQYVKVETSRCCIMSRLLCKESIGLSKPIFAHGIRSLRTALVSCLQDNTTEYFNFMVISSGVAGLSYALEVSKHGSVTGFTKAESYESNTNYAQGSVSVVLGPSDSVESHMQDAIIAGAYLCEEATVRVVCTEGPERVKELIAMGASFDNGEDRSMRISNMFAPNPPPDPPDDIGVLRLEDKSTLMGVGMLRCNAP